MFALCSWSRTAKTSRHLDLAGGRQGKVTLFCMNYDTDTIPPPLQVDLPPDVEVEVADWIAINGCSVAEGRPARWAAVATITDVASPPSGERFQHLGTVEFSMPSVPAVQLAVVRESAGRMPLEQGRGVNAAEREQQ